jgi:methylthioribulose-1-phosphate dehydratase
LEHDEAKPMSPNRSELSRPMIDAARAFYHHGWLMGTSGNLSVRWPMEEAFLISASGKDKGTLSEEDFLVCDFEGRPAEQTLHRPSAETLVHCEIYRRFPQVGAVFHVHQLHAALCSARDRSYGETNFADLEMIKGLDIWEEGAQIAVPILDNLHDIPALARSVGEYLDSSRFDARIPAVNIYNHGIYAWGSSPAAAKRHVETLGYLYHYSWEFFRRP